MDSDTHGPPCFGGSSREMEAGRSILTVNARDVSGTVPQLVGDGCPAFPAPPLFPGQAQDRSVDLEIAPSQNSELKHGVS